MAEDIAYLPATRLLELYRNKQLSPVEVMAETLRRFAGLPPQLQRGDEDARSGRTIPPREISAAAG